MNINKNECAMVTRHGFLDLQVCVPVDWTDKQITQFANTAQDCGTRGGWFLRKNGDPLLVGDLERVMCLERSNFVHLLLDA